MIEVELKAWADLEAARTRLEALGKKPTKACVKEDVYFRAGERTVRLRVEGDKAFVTAKRKQVQDGVETSEEIEFEADSPDAVRAFFGYLGFEPFIRKRKESRAYAWRSGLVVELNRIVGLGDFVEVETLLEDGAGPEELARARGEVREVLRALGVSDERIEPKPYTALLRERGVGVE